MSSKTKSSGSALPYLYAALFIVTIWQLVVTLTDAHVALLPPPLLTAESFWELIVSGELFVHIGASLGRVVSAWLLSAVIAIPLGLAMGHWTRFEKVVDPVVELFRPISPLAWMPLLLYSVQNPTWTAILGFVAVTFASINVVGGYMVTHRMLAMFKKKG